MRYTPALHQFSMNSLLDMHSKKPNAGGMPTIIFNIFVFAIVSATRQIKREFSMEWDDNELADAVKMYLTMQRQLKSGQPVSKANVYRELAEQHPRRTAKAFEYRMQNISAVLKSMGREWITGLKPAENVGNHVADRIQNLVIKNTLDSKISPPPSSSELNEPKGQYSPNWTQTIRSSFVRDDAVRAWVLNQAKGVCECCGKKAPFMDSNGDAFLEVHHVTFLSEGGADTIGNAIAVCPNCHRELHFGQEKLSLKQSLIKRITRLVQA
jgi:5-methylcytosine-specific restriction protein A